MAECVFKPNVKNCNNTNNKVVSTRDAVDIYKRLYDVNFPVFNYYSGKVKKNKENKTF